MTQEKQANHRYPRESKSITSKAQKERDLAIEHAEQFMTSSLDDFVHWALENHHSFAADPSKLKWEPDEAFEEATRVWGFVRLLKARPELRHLDAMAALELIYPAMEMFSFFSPSPWEEQFNLNPLDADVFFHSSWEKVEFPKSPDPIALAWWKVSASGPATFATRRPAHYRTFITLTAYLQQARGSQPIALPCEKLALFINGSKMRVSRSIQWGVTDGFLHPHKPASRGGRLAAEYYGTNVLDPRFGFKREEIELLLHDEHPQPELAEVAG